MNIEPPDSGLTRTVVFPSELGWMCAAWRNGLLRELAFGHASPDQAVRALQHASVCPTEPNRDERQLVHRLQKFACRATDDFSDIELELSEHTAFQRRVVEACRAIPLGETLTYAELARQAGHPGAARAVGQVMATNRFPLIVPCHRVVASGGSIGGFSAPDGLSMKRRLLALEQQSSAALVRK
jgi:methylated-DNA-[protein]-cysteine S-methyltransferase